MHIKNVKSKKAIQIVFRCINTLNTKINKYFENPLIVYFI